MPEGPSIAILKEQVSQFARKKVKDVSGNTKIDLLRLRGKTVREFRSWGKHFLICFDGFVIRIHLLLFGSYRINDEKHQTPMLSLVFSNGMLNFYTCSVEVLEGSADEHYEWSADVMSDAWDAKNAAEKLRGIPQKQVCDALLEQDIFGGVGNIIKNEVLYRIKVHPESLVGKLPPVKKRKMVEEARNYSFDFLEWKKQYELKKHWQAHTKKVCSHCNGPITKKITGVKKRRSFFCSECQRLYQ